MSLEPSSPATDQSYLPASDSTDLFDNVAYSDVVDTSEYDEKELGVIKLVFFIKSNFLTFFNFLVKN